MSVFGVLNPDSMSSLYTILLSQVYNCRNLLKIIMNKSDSLGDRMKSQYEIRSQTFLPRRTYTILRLDGKAFHTYTRGLIRPFDADFMAIMDAVAVRLCEQVQGAVLAYVQSDEISLLLADFADIATQAWFDGNVQKMVSISASIATAEFNLLSPKIGRDGRLALFDSRVFVIPDATEVQNYFVWRHQDCRRNAIQMAAQSMFSHKALQGVSCQGLLEMMGTLNGIDFDVEYPQGARWGRMVSKHSESFVVPAGPNKGQTVVRKKFLAKPTEDFVANWEALSLWIPRSMSY